MKQCAVCILASQIANYGESYIGATLQDKEGFEWVSSALLPDQNTDASSTSLHELFQLICFIMLHTFC
jgi:uncharacterized membrane protein